MISFDSFVYNYITHWPDEFDKWNTIHVQNFHFKIYKLIENYREF